MKSWKEIHIRNCTFCSPVVCLVWNIASLLPGDLALVKASTNQCGKQVIVQHLQPGGGTRVCGYQQSSSRHGAALLEWCFASEEGRFCQLCLGKACTKSAQNSKRPSHGMQKFLTLYILRTTVVRCWDWVVCGGTLPVHGRSGLRKSIKTGWEAKTESTSFLRHWKSEMHQK